MCLMDESKLLCNFRLKDESAVCKIIEDLEKYLRLQGQVTDEELCRVYLKRIQHSYYKV